MFWIILGIIWYLIGLISIVWAIIEDDDILLEDLGRILVGGLWGPIFTILYFFGEYGDIVVIRRRKHD